MHPRNSGPISPGKVILTPVANPSSSGTSFFLAYSTRNAPLIPIDKRHAFRSHPCHPCHCIPLHPGEVLGVKATTAVEIQDGGRWAGAWRHEQRVPLRTRSPSRGSAPLPTPLKRGLEDRNRRQAPRTTSRATRAPLRASSTQGNVSRQVPSLPAVLLTPNL